MGRVHIPESPGSRVPDSGYRIPDPLYFGSWIPDPRSWGPGTGPSQLCGNLFKKSALENIVCSI